eukprot:2919841-Rhodomonas_salina.2
MAETIDDSEVRVKNDGPLVAHSPLRESMCAALKATKVCIVRSRFTPTTTAASQSQLSTALHAASIATSDDEQVVSIDIDGPLNPSTREMRLADRRCSLPRRTQRSHASAPLMDEMSLLHFPTKDPARAASSAPIPRPPCSIASCATSNTWALLWVHRHRHRPRCSDPELQMVQQTRPLDQRSTVRV